MRQSLLAILGIVLAGSTLAVMAVDEHHPEGQPGAAAGAPQAADPNTALKQMKDNADKLRTQVDKIAKTKDPAERRKLVQEHMQTLRAGMMAANGMMGGGAGSMSPGMSGGGMGAGMMECPMMGQMMGQMGGGGEAVANRLNHIERRLDMMQKMLEQGRKP